MAEKENPMAVIGVDVGGTQIKAATFFGSKHGAITRVPTAREEGPEAITKRVLKLITEMVGAEPAAKAIGIALAGEINEETGVAEASENLGWDKVPFRQLIQEATSLPVGVGHDVRAGGVAEMTFGALRGVTDGLFMPIGTGISGAMVIGGVLNSHRLGGEIGHLDVGTERACACGSKGCLETIATGPSIAARYLEKSGNQVPGAAEVVARANAGELAAQEVWSSAIEAIAVALTSYISILAPSVVVIGGGVSKSGDGLIKPLRESLQKKLVWQQLPQLRIAELGDLATCIGASILAQRAYQNTITS